MIAKVIVFRESRLAIHLVSMEGVLINKTNINKKNFSDTDLGGVNLG